MDDVAITSTRNVRVVETAKLHQRKVRAERGLTLIEGPHLLALALQSGMNVPTVFRLVEDQHLADVPGDVETLTVTSDVLRRLAGTEHPRGPVAVLEIPEARPIEHHNTVVMVGISDPGNAGTIVRSAAAFGFHVATTTGTVDLWAPKVLRSAAGAHFITHIATVADDPFGALAAAEVTSAALVVAGGIAPRALSARPVGILVGSEAHGLEPSSLQAADHQITLAMPGGTESLNAAIAASIVMYELATNR